MILILNIVSKTNRAHVIRLSNVESICDANIRQPADFVLTVHGKLIVFHFIKPIGSTSFVNEK